MGSHHTNHTGLIRAGWVTAILMPVVGFIIGIVLLTKDQGRKGAAIMCVAVLVGVASLFAFQALTQPAQDCSVVSSLCVDR